MSSGKGQGAQGGDAPARPRLAKAASIWRRDADLEEQVSKHEAHRRVSGWRYAFVAYSTLGVVFGDIGTSPLYCFATIFNNLDATDENVVLGTFSMVFWSITVIAGLQYVVILLSMDDNGEGGTFALYSLICRAASIRTVGRVHETEQCLSGFAAGQDDGDGDEARPARPTVAERVQRSLAGSAVMQKVLLCIVMLAACMLMADGVMTPSISVVSAIEGLQLKVDLSQNAVAGIAIGVIVVLFAAQPLGTDRVSFLFSPFLLLWFLSNAGIGIFNITKVPSVFKALSPSYIGAYWRSDAHMGWVGLGSVFLSITGCEALYADMGHFSAGAIRLSFFTIVYPALTLAYLGQTAVLLQRPDAAERIYWQAVPTPLFWPMLVLATIATIVASQALITGAFSVAQQAVSLNVFPRFTIKHTNEKHSGQIYVPQINWLLMLGCIVVIVIFRSSSKLGNAYGMAVVVVMLLSTLLATLCLLTSFPRIPPPAVALYFCVYVFAESAFLSSNVLKVPQGAWFPIALSVVLFLLAYTWHYGQTLKSRYLAAHTVKLTRLLRWDAGNADGDGGDDGRSSVSSLGGGARLPPGRALLSLPSMAQRQRAGGELALRLSDGTPVSRAAGVGVYFTEQLDGVGPSMARFLSIVPSVHDIVVLLTLRRVPVPHVLPEEALLVRKLALPGFYHVVLRSGYMDETRFDRGFDDLVTEEVLAYLSAEVRQDLQSVAEDESGGEGQGGEGMLLARLEAPQRSLRWGSPPGSKVLGRSARPTTAGGGKEEHLGQVAITIDGDDGVASRPASPAMRPPALATLATMKRGSMRRRAPVPPPSVFAAAAAELASNGGGKKDDGGGASTSDGGAAWVQQPTVYRRVRTMTLRNRGLSAAGADGPLSVPLPAASYPALDDKFGTESMPLPAAPPRAPAQHSVPAETNAQAAHTAGEGGEAGMTPARSGALQEAQKRLFRAISTVSGDLHSEVSEGEGRFEAERAQLRAARQRGVFFLIGQSHLRASPRRNWFSRYVLEYVYSFLVAAFPSTTAMYHVPPTQTLELSVTYAV